MSAEPNNAEEQLKRYAEERRQVVPNEIHPATRNVLQGEVARTYGRPVTGGRTLRWRWMQAVAWIVILVAIPMFFMPRNPATKTEEQSLPGARQDQEVLLDAKTPAATAPIVLSDAPAPVVPTAPSVAGVAEAAPQRKVTVTQTSARARVSKERDESKDASKKLEVRAAAAPSPLAADAVAANELSFANNVASPLLNNFRMQQTGTNLRILDDADGSEYPGKIFSQTAAADAFRATGLNRKLNQTVTITGQVVRMQYANSQQAQQSRVSNFSNPAANFNRDDVRVQGQAVYGDNNQIKIDAQLAPAR
jgi:hypothetical protein